MDVVANARGLVLLDRGARKESVDLLESARLLYLKALDSFEQSLRSSPLDVELLHNCARKLGGAIEPRACAPRHQCTGHAIRCASMK